MEDAIASQQKDRKPGEVTCPIRNKYRHSESETEWPYLLLSSLYG